MLHAVGIPHRHQYVAGPHVDGFFGYFRMRIQAKFLGFLAIVRL